MDVEKILEVLEQHHFIRRNRRMNNWFSIYCPFHSDGNEKKPSFGVLLQDEVRGGQVYKQGFGHCFTCGYAKSLPEMVEDILKTKSISKSGLEWLAENIPGFIAQDVEFDYLIPQELIQTAQAKYALSYIQEKISAAVPTPISEEELASYRYTVPYMYERKLTNEIIEKFDVGVDLKWIPPGRVRPVPCITFPVKDAKGTTLFLCRRSIKGKLYNYPEGVVKPVYGLDQITSEHTSIIICESIINALTCWVYGYPAVALLGTGNAYQLQQLKELGVKEYILGMDGDDAGHRATAKLHRNLKSVAIVWTMHLPEGKDINDLSREEFQEIYDNRD